MAEHHAGPIETGAPMDYREHEKTYNMFVSAAKYGTLVIAALLLAMAAGFFGGAGFLGGILVFIVVVVGGTFLLR